jgi:CheY-like chemotaxis protein/DNA-binding XRE family transcriptional regulator
MSSEENNIHSIDSYIGKQIKKRRQKLNLTLSALAEKIGVSHQMVTKYESGKTRLPVAVLHDIAKALAVEYSYFLDGFEDKNPPKEETKTINRSCSRPLHILLVEDDPGDVFLIEKIIASLPTPVEMYHVHDGEQALDFIKGNRQQYDFPTPDLILLDLNIPKRTGHEVLKAIKSDRTVCHIPVVIMTSSIIRDEMKRVYQNYAAGYICKSFDVNIMTQALTHLAYYWSTVVMLPNRN